MIRNAVLVFYFNSSTVKYSSIPHRHYIEISVAFYYWHYDASSFGTIYFPPCFVVDKNYIVIDKNDSHQLP